MGFPPSRKEAKKKEQVKSKEFHNGKSSSKLELRIAWQLRKLSLIYSLLLCGFEGRSLRRPAFKDLMHENEIARIIVDSAFKIHTSLGPGLLESVYTAVLAHELTRRGLRVKTQQGIPVTYEDIKLELGFRADIIVNSSVVIEVKSVEAIAPVHAKQLRTYLRLTETKLGLLINFNVDLIKHGIQRVVNGL